jgi:hypothetical protein
VLQGTVAGFEVRAAKYGQLEVCRLSLQCNADVNAKDGGQCLRPDYCFYEAKLCLRKLILLLFFRHRTPLHCSAFHGRLEVCHLLVESKS